MRGRQASRPAGTRALRAPRMPRSIVRPLSPAGSGGGHGAGTLARHGPQHRSPRQHCGLKAPYSPLLCGPALIPGVAVGPGRPLYPRGEHRHVLAQLLRLVHLEVDAEHREPPQREPVEVVVGRAILAGMVVDGLEPSPLRGHPPAERSIGACRVTRLVAAWRGGQALRHVRRAVFGRQHPSVEAHAGGRWTGEAVDPEGSPASAAGVPGD